MGDSPYMTISEAAAFLLQSVTTVKRKMTSGELREGFHYFKRTGMQPRFKRAALEAYIEHRDDVIPMARGGRRRAVGE